MAKSSACWTSRSRVPILKSGMANGSTVPLSDVMVALKDEIASSRSPESNALWGSDINAYLDMAVVTRNGGRSRPDEETARGIRRETRNERE